MVFTVVVVGTFFVNCLKERIFPKTYKNPNGCPIHGTFYVSHEYTNYAMINKLWNQGHEISVHSITKRKPESWWEGNATIEDWFDEMVGQVRYCTLSVSTLASEISRGALIERSP